MGDHVRSVKLFALELNESLGDLRVFVGIVVGFSAISGLFPSKFFKESFSGIFENVLCIQATSNGILWDSEVGCIFICQKIIKKT